MPTHQVTADKAWDDVAAAMCVGGAQPGGAQPGAALRAQYAHILLPYERSFAPHVADDPTAPSPKRQRAIPPPAPAEHARAHAAPPPAAKLPPPGQLRRALLTGTPDQLIWALDALLRASSDPHSGLRLDELPSMAMALCFVVTRAKAVGPHASGVTAARARLLALLRELPGRQAEVEEDGDGECVDSISARRSLRAGVTTAAAAIGPAAEAGVLNDPTGETEHQEVAAGRAAARILRNAAWSICCEPTGSGAFHLGWHAHLVLTVVCQCVEQEVKDAQACLEQAGTTADFLANPLLAGRFAMTTDLIDVAHCITTPPWSIHNRLSGKETHCAGQWPAVAARIATVLLSVPPTCTPLWPTRPAAGAALLSRLAAAVPGKDMVRVQMRASAAAATQADRPKKAVMAGVAVALHTQAQIFSEQGPLGGDVAPLLLPLLALLRVVPTPPSPATAAAAAAAVTHTVPEAAACALARLLELQPSIAAPHKQFLLSNCYAVANAAVSASKMTHATAVTKKGVAAVLAALGNIAAASGGRQPGEGETVTRWSRALCALVTDASPEVAFHACTALTAMANSGARGRAA